MTETDVMPKGQQPSRHRSLREYIFAPAYLTWRGKLGLVVFALLPSFLCLANVPVSRDVSDVFSARTHAHLYWIWDLPDPSHSTTSQGHYRFEYAEYFIRFIVLIPWTLLVWIIVRSEARNMRRNRGECWNCGYDVMRRRDGECPECGSTLY